MRISHWLLGTTVAIPWKRDPKQKPAAVLTMATAMTKTASTAPPLALPATIPRKRQA